MPATTTRRRSVDLPVDAETAYAFLTDLSFLPEWYPGLTDITGATSSEPHTGSRFVEHRRLAPGVSVPIGLTVTEADPGRTFRVAAHRRGIGTVEGCYELDQVGPERTRVTVSHAVRPALPLAAPVAAALSAMLARADRRQLTAMRGGVTRWRGE